MDWNKTKTIFIIVFSILNVFLYSLYLNRYTEAQNVRVMGEVSIEESLQLDNITYEELPTHYEEASYILAEVVRFREDELDELDNQIIHLVDDTQLFSMLEDSVSIRNAKGDYDFMLFLSTHVLNGEDYVLWKVDEENRQALFFQKVNDSPIYYNQNAMLTVYWDKDEEIISYEQRMFGEFDSYNKKKDLLPPIQAINTLYARGHLKQDSNVKHIELGYSTLIQLTETQVFAPTWRLHVELGNEEVEDYFINAIDGKIIEFHNDFDFEDDE